MRFKIREKSNLIFLLFLVCVLSWPLSLGNAQFLDQKEPLDFEKIFKEGLQRRGKYLNLSGKKIGDDKKSLTFALAFQSADKTLTDEEVNPVFENIVQTLADNLGSALRE